MNHTGIPYIYLAVSRALSLLEYTAHAALLPPAVAFTTFEVPERSIRQLQVNELPPTCFQQPYSKDSQEIGSALLAKKNACY